MMRDLLLDVAQSGVLAPSADNRHVFQIELADSAIRLWPTREFKSCTDRLRRVLGLISLGAVAENMRLRAGELGYDATTRWLLDEADGPLAQVDFQPAVGPCEDLASGIPLRHTNRRMYRGPALDAGETAALDAAVDRVDGVRLVWLQGDARRRALRLIWLAESERFRRRALHEELFGSIRFDLNWRESADDAIPPGALEVEAPMRPMFKALRHWSLMRPLTWVGAHRLLGLRAAWLPCAQAPALGFLATDLPIEPGAIAAGTALERLWLRATLLGLGFQPMAGSAVLPLQTGVEEGVSASLRQGLTDGWQAISPGRRPVMVFRLGHAIPPTIISGRRPLSTYLHSANY